MDTYRERADVIMREQMARLADERYQRARQRLGGMVPGTAPLDTAMREVVDAMYERTERRMDILNARIEQLTKEIRGR